MRKFWGFVSNCNYFLVCGEQHTTYYKPLSGNQSNHQRHMVISEFPQPVGDDGCFMSCLCSKCSTSVYYIAGSWGHFLTDKTLLLLELGNQELQVHTHFQLPVVSPWAPAQLSVLVNGHTGSQCWRVVYKSPKSGSWLSRFFLTFHFLLCAHPYQCLHHLVSVICLHLLLHPCIVLATTLKSFHRVQNMIFRARKWCWKCNKITNPIGMFTAQKTVMVI